MTQIDELVKRARSLCDGPNDRPAHILSEELRAFADALEAQADRVKELEKKCVDYATAVKSRSLHIATLEAQLEAFREALSEISTYPEEATEVPRSHKADYLLSCVQMLAHDALMSALRNTEMKDG